jgi:hypothetical protein
MQQPDRGPQIDSIESLLEAIRQAPEDWARKAPTPLQKQLLEAIQQQEGPSPLQKELMDNALRLYPIVEARMMREYKESRKGGQLKPEDEPDIIDILAESAKYARDLWLQVRDMDFDADDDDDDHDPDGGEPVEVIAPHYTRRRAS